MIALVVAIVVLFTTAGELDGDPMPYAVGGAAATAFWAIVVGGGLLALIAVDVGGFGLVSAYRTFRERRRRR